MAISASAVWEVRNTGSDSNGGFYTSGGTDYSQQDSPQLSLTDVVTNGTTTVTSATGGFTAAMIGNGINIAGSIYQITARASSTSITIDRNATSGTGQTGKVGGACATIGKVSALMVLGNICWIKAGSGYSISSNLTYAYSGGELSPSAPYTRFFGYGSTRGDGTRAVITLQTGATAGFATTPSNTWIRWIEVDCNNIASSTGISIGQFSYVSNCKIYNHKVTGITGQAIIESNEVGASTSTGDGITTANLGQIRLNYIHDCAGIGISAFSASVNISQNIIANVGGVGIRCAQQGSVVSNTIYAAGSHGISANSTLDSTIIKNNLIVSCGGAGLRFDGTLINTSAWEGNAFYNNSGGNRDSSTGTSSIASPDVLLTGSPFTNAAAGDYSLNNTAGAGAACRGAGVPGSFAGGTTRSYTDFGAVQHQDAGGGGGGVVRVGFNGGFGG